MNNNEDRIMKREESHLITTDYPRRSGEAGLPPHKLPTRCCTTPSPSPLGRSHPSPSGRPLLDEQPVPAKAEVPQGRGSGLELELELAWGEPKGSVPRKKLPRSGGCLRLKPLVLVLVMWLGLVSVGRRRRQDESFET